MEQETPKESKQETLGYIHVLDPRAPEEPSLKQLGNETDGQQKKEDNQFGSPTPPPVVQPPRIKQKGDMLPFRAVKQIPEFFHNADVGTKLKAEDSVKLNVMDEVNELPENYKLLAEFFDRLDTSVRLLGLRKKLATFHNISIQVEILTKRKFLYSHLAQIKYIFPEAVKIEKILKHDEITLFMKPDMKVTLLPNAVNAQPDQSVYMALCLTFRSRLLDFFKSHPEDADIPEALLPEPFNQNNASVVAEVLPLELYEEVQQPISESESILNSSLLSPSFCNHFSQKYMVPKTDKARSPPRREASSTNLTTENCSMELLCSPTRSSDYSFSGTTPSKLVFTPLAETPVQKTPKRPVPSPYGSSHVSNDTSSHSATKRSLKFSRSKAERDPSLAVDVTLENQDGEETNEEYRLDQNDKDECQPKSARLTDLFNTIYVIFQNLKYSSVTKQELLHKILWQKCDITETRVVEEQLDLLEELIPEWFCKNITFGGHILYSLKRTSNPDFVRAKLGQAI
ncbi:CDT1-like protein a, chloroplastic [Aristolochia californica]|uniref:CDT1-like protein a, chloroplastic n=1 Tax=Aristolochia californica TaxID=171875 RepID=UPI0035E33F93